MNVIVIALVLVILVQPFVVAQDSSSSNTQAVLTYEQSVQFNQLLVQANALMQHHDWNNALPLLEQMCRLCPTSAILHCNFGNAYVHTGNLDEALRQYQCSWSLDPNNASTARCLASYYLEQGDTQDGKLWLQKCINAAQPSEVAQVAEANSTLSMLAQSGCKVGAGDKSAPDYVADLKCGKGGRWASDKIPLKVFFQDTASVPCYRSEFNGYVKSALGEWVAATNGKLSWVEVPTSDSADIICEWQDKPKGNMNEGGTALHSGYVDANGMEIIEGAEVTLFTMGLDPSSPKLIPISDQSAQHIAMHEIGHVLGVLGHSSNLRDIMFFCTDAAAPTTVLSQRDKNTILRLYQNCSPEVSASVKTSAKQTPSKVSITH